MSSLPQNPHHFFCNPLLCGPRLLSMLFVVSLDGRNSDSRSLRIRNSWPNMYSIRVGSPSEDTWGGVEHISIYVIKSTMMSVLWRNILHLSLVACGDGVCGRDVRVSQHLLCL